MTISTHPSYRYVHPHELLDTVRSRKARGSQLVFPCPMCHEKASFSTVERIGRCFVCQGIIKLHTTYDGTPLAQLFPTLPHTRGFSSSIRSWTGT